MLVTNHVLSGAFIGALVRKPVPAFVIGVASHFVLDMVPHYGDPGCSQQKFLKVAVPDGLAGLAAMAVLATAAVPSKRTAVLAGMAGAALPDLDKPARLWFGRSPWPGPVNRFHGAIQNETPDRFAREMATVALFAAISFFAVSTGSRDESSAFGVHRGSRVKCPVWKLSAGG